MEPETHPFQAEVSKVMDIIINSLYTNKDVFLRELISNAADACDKKRHLLNSNVQDLEIRIKPDKAKNQLIIEDEGVGMSKEELISNLGTIARSGTSQFINQISDENDANNLIGKFGVGFYSSYLVANQVDVLSRKFQDDTKQILRWSSSSGGTFTVSSVDDVPDFMNSGTRITLHLKNDSDEYLEDYKIKDLLKKYSEFIGFPIKVWSERVEYDRVQDTSSFNEGTKKPRVKTVTKKYYEWDIINKQVPIWKKNPNDLSENEYQQFYKSTFKAYDDYLAKTHFKVDGQIDFSCLLFIPGSIPWELTKNMFDEGSRGIRLYVKRVFINDNFSEAIPRWLTFIRGIVDSNELPLNVGREILQKSRMLSLINRKITSQAIEMMRLLKLESQEKWETFWKNYGKYIKIGVVEDRDNQNEIASLIEFHSTNSDNMTSLDHYIERMKPNQTSIYFVSAENRQAASSSPSTEKLKKYGYEILYATEPIDEFCLSTLSINKYKEYDVIDVNKAEVKIPENNNKDNENEAKDVESSYSELCEWIQNEFGKKLQKVIVSDRLVESPALLAQGDFGLSPTMERYMKQQAATQGVSESELFGMNANQYILEINPDHDIIKNLRHIIDLDKSSPIAKEILHQLYDVISLQGGYTISDTHLFAKRVIALMQTDAKRRMQEAYLTTTTLGVSPPT